MSVHRTYSAILSMSIIACGTDPASPTPGAGVSPFTLALVGSDDLTLHPDEARLLHVVVTQDDAGPVPDARIHFELRDGDAGGALIDAADVITDEDGIARVTFTAGPRPVPVPFHLAASTPDLGAAPVAFTIAVIPERRLLEIVPSAATRVSDDGRSATTLAGVSASVALRVRELDADTFEPIAGDRITFTLPPVASSRWSATSSRIATASTGMGGEARVYLITSQAAEGPWQVVAQGAGGDASVTFEVRVQGQLCPIDSDGCGEDEPVPECDPAAPACGSGQCCDPVDRVCRETCVRDGNVPDLSGDWVTRHDFDLRHIAAPERQHLSQDLHSPRRREPAAGGSGLVVDHADRDEVRQAGNARLRRVVAEPDQRPVLPAQRGDAAPALGGDHLLVLGVGLDVGGHVLDGQAEQLLTRVAEDIAGVLVDGDVPHLVVGDEHEHVGGVDRLAEQGLLDHRRGQRQRFGRRIVGHPGVPSPIETFWLPLWFAPESGASL